MEDKPKLLLVADTYYPKVDGIMVFIEQFIQRAKHRFNISLLVPNFQQRKDTKDKTFLRISKFMKMGDYNSIFPGWFNLRKIKKKIKENDIIFIQGPTLLSYLAMYYGKKYNKKVITYVHVITWELFAKFLPKKIGKFVLKTWRWINIKLYNSCDLVIVPYHDLKKELVDKGIKTDIIVARLGVDINRFIVPRDKSQAKKNLGIDPSKRVIGY
ncbi:MAG: glycosyltransferase, partial [Nanoarchaeota archaeon]|nr:glycosyltransferase [Nanoarchaeota archaeon]